jgi:hypothetical protein
MVEEREVTAFGVNAQAESPADAMLDPGLRKG